MYGRTSVRRLALATFVSVSGTGAAGVALAAGVYLQSHSTAWLAGALLATPLVVGGILTPVSGWVADRFDRRMVIVTGEVESSAVYVALIFAHQPAVLIGLRVVAVAVVGPVRAALAAAVPNLVPGDDLTWANGVLKATANAALIVGPAAGGALVAGAGTGGVFALVAATFSVSAAITARIPGRFSSSSPNRPQRPRVGAGFAFIAADPRLMTLVAVSCLSSFAVGIVTLADLPLARSFGAGPAGYGLLAGALSAGVIAGSRLAAPVGRAKRERVALVAGAAAMAVAVGAVAVLPSFSAIVAAAALAGSGAGVAFAPWLTLMQRGTDDQRRGIIMATAICFEDVGMAAGMVTGPALITVLGTQHAYLFPAAVLAAVAVIAARIDTSHRYLAEAHGRSSSAELWKSAATPRPARGGTHDSSTG
jgi:MFS family permease